jgi:hypothetical protein
MIVRVPGADPSPAIPAPFTATRRTAIRSRGRSRRADSPARRHAKLARNGGRTAVYCVQHGEVLEVEDRPNALLRGRAAQRVCLRSFA